MLSRKESTWLHKLIARRRGVTRRPCCPLLRKKKHPPHLGMSTASVARRRCVTRRPCCLLPTCEM